MHVSVESTRKAAAAEQKKEKNFLNNESKINKAIKAHRESNVHITSIRREIEEMK